MARTVKGTTKYSFDASKVQPVDVGKWADITIERWKRELERYDRVTTRKLYNSFTREVRQTNDRIEVEFQFETYFRFIDMGVGNGVHYTDVKALRKERMQQRGSAAGTRRKPVPVFSRPLYKEANILADLLGDYYGNKIITTIAEEFLHGIDIKL